MAPPEIVQNLREGAGMRIDGLIVWNDLQRPDRVRGHVPPFRGVSARSNRGRAANEPKPLDWRLANGSVDETDARCLLSG